MTNTFWVKVTSHGRAALSHVGELVNMNPVTMLVIRIFIPGMLYLKSRHVDQYLHVLQWL